MRRYLKKSKSKDLLFRDMMESDIIDYCKKFKICDTIKSEIIINGEL